MSWSCYYAGTPKAVIKAIKKDPYMSGDKAQDQAKNAADFIIADLENPGSHNYNGVIVTASGHSHVESGKTHCGGVEIKITRVYLEAESNNSSVESES